MDISPGDWVECINDVPDPDSPFRVQVLVCGALYCIEFVSDHSFDKNGKCIGDFYKLVGTPFAPDGSMWVFAADRFRPIRDGQERISKPEKVTA